ncbi:MAG: HAD hydrolase-like protein [Galbitalea sp.]
MPATGSVAALISKATGKEPYVVGKPNPMMFRSAMNKIGAHSENTGMIGDRMDNRHRRRNRGRPAHRARAHRHQRPGRDRAVPVPADEVLESVADLLEREPVESDN